MKLLITGSSGFIGSALVREALSRDLDVRPVYRRGSASANCETPPLSLAIIERLDGQTDWQESLRGVDVVVHCAARAAAGTHTNDGTIADFREVNVEATLNLARQASMSGAKRFVFISSIKVNGEMTRIGAPFTPEDNPSPQDVYGQSKADAEAGLLQICRETALEFCIIRPPIVYGPGVKGNFLSLFKYVRSGAPLPFGAIKNNRRSLIGIDNLVDFILLSAEHASAANQTYLVSDGEDLSTAELIKRMASSLDRPARLVSVPSSLLRVTARLLGKEDVASRLLDSLQVDLRKNIAHMNWRPRVSVNEGLIELGKTL
jgi:nucleoside-diphosphate-sugar epimerase